MSRLLAICKGNEVMHVQWVRVSGSDADSSDVPLAVIPGWEGMQFYFKLQFRDHKGKWLDVPVGESDGS